MLLIIILILTFNSFELAVCLQRELPELPKSVIDLTTNGRFGNDYIYNEILSQVLNKTIYKSQIRPYAETAGKRVNVLVSTYLRAINGISEQNMDFSMDFDLILSWQDPRIAFGNITSAPNNSYMLVRQNSIDKIWLPGVYFENERKGNVHQLMQTNAAMRIYANGTVVYSVRVTITFACPMRLKNYPMDAQWCDMVIGTYTYPQRDLTFNWQEVNPVEYSNTLQNPKFSLIKSATRTTACELDRGGDKYSCVTLSLRFKREFPFHIIQTYVPTILLVMASWLSFWIDPKAVPARISLNVTTLLSIVTMMTAVRLNLPPVSDVKAIDVWMFMCTLYIFAAMLEYSLVGHALIRAQQHKSWVPDNFMSFCRKKKKEDTHTIIMLDSSSVESGQASPAKKNAKPDPPNPDTPVPWYMDVDKISRFAFPITFVLFNLLYWSTYLNID